MIRFHIKDNGDPGRCIAKKGKCPKSAEETHFDTMAEARAYSEASLAAANSNGMGSLSKSKTRRKGYARNQKVQELPPYSFQGGNIKAAIEARGSTGLADPYSGRELTVSEVAQLLKGEKLSSGNSEQFSFEEATVMPNSFISNKRNEITKDTVFYHASIVPLEDQMKRSEIRSVDDDRNWIGSGKEFRETAGYTLSDMGTTPQYAIDNMLSEGEADGFYVYELKARHDEPLQVYNLAQDDRAIDFADAETENDRLREETGDRTAAFTFYSRYNDPGSIGVAADPGTMDVVGKRWVSAEEARKSPSIYNL